MDFINDLSFDDNSISYQKVKSLFTIEDFANDLDLDKKTASYQIKTNLMPLGFVKLVKSHSHLERGRYHEFSLTQVGIDFLNYIFE